MDTCRKMLFYCCLGHPDDFEEETLVPITTKNSVITSSIKSQLYSIIPRQVVPQKDKKVAITPMKKAPSTELDKVNDEPFDNIICKVAADNPDLLILLNDNKSR